MSVWYEIVLEGSEDALDAFLDRYEAGPDQVVRGDDLDLAGESLSQKVRELLHARTHHLLFAPAPSARTLLRSLESTEGLAVDKVREVTHGRFGFEAKAFSKEVGTRIHEALRRDVPEGVRIEGFEESEETHPEAEGVELYSPAHDYVYEARGTVVGPPPGVFEMQRRARALEFCRPKAMHLEARDLRPEELPYG
jgi:hypothetical protein